LRTNHSFNGYKFGNIMFAGKWATLNYKNRSDGDKNKIHFKIMGATITYRRIPTARPLTFMIVCYVRVNQPWISDVVITVTNHYQNYWPRDKTVKGNISIYKKKIKFNLTLTYKWPWTWRSDYCNLTVVAIIGTLGDKTLEKIYLTLIVIWHWHLRLN
jgi:hypothetical protein